MKKVNLKNLKRGDTLTIEVELMFGKGIEKRQVKVVGIFGDKILLSDGTTLKK